MKYEGESCWRFKGPLSAAVNSALIPSKCVWPTDRACFSHYTLAQHKRRTRCLSMFVFVCVCMCVHVCVCVRVRVRVCVRVHIEIKTEFSTMQQTHNGTNHLKAQSPFEHISTT